MSLHVTVVLVRLNFCFPME